MKQNSNNQIQDAQVVESAAAEATQQVSPKAKTSILEVQVPAMILPSTDQLNDLDKLEASFSLTLKYKTADDWAALKDQPIRAFYQGLKEIPNDKGEFITCGVFITKRECFIAGQMLIVDAVRSLKVGTPIEIIYRGKSANKNTDGSTMKFDVTVLS